MLRRERYGSPGCTLHFQSTQPEPPYERAVGGPVCVWPICLEITPELVKSVMQGAAVVPLQKPLWVSAENNFTSCCRFSGLSGHGLGSAGPDISPAAVTSILRGITQKDGVPSVSR
ncbi:UNVERIFIED_CONTAM: hypothetical protein K2H54_065480 [Gekko kuhli]